MMPPAPHTAIAWDKWDTATYTGIWNYLDYPAVVLPVGTVQDSDSADEPSNAKYGEEDLKIYDLCMLVLKVSAVSAESMMLTLGALDTGPDFYEDAPICVQLVGYRPLDETLLNVAAVVESVIKG